VCDDRLVRTLFGLSAVGHRDAKARGADALDDAADDGALRARAGDDRAAARVAARPARADPEPLRAGEAAGVNPIRGTASSACSHVPSPDAATALLTARPRAGARALDRGDRDPAVRALRQSRLGRRRS